MGQNDNLKSLDKYSIILVKNIKRGGVPNATKNTKKSC